MTLRTTAFVRVNYEAGDRERGGGFTNHKTYIFTAASPLKHTHTTHPARNGGPADRYVYQVDQVNAARTRPKTLKQATEETMTKEILQLNRAIKEFETRSKDATGGRGHLRKKNNTWLELKWKTDERNVRKGEEEGKKTLGK